MHVLQMYTVSLQNMETQRVCGHVNPTLWGENISQVGNIQKMVCSPRGACKSYHK